MIVQNAISDQEFSVLEEKFSTLRGFLETSCSGDHVGEIERSNQTLKERIRTIWNRLPFKEYTPCLVTIGLVGYAIICLNNEYGYEGIASELSPRWLITGKYLEYKYHCQIGFGE